VDLDTSHFRSLSAPGCEFQRGRMVRLECWKVSLGGLPVIVFSPAANCGARRTCLPRRFRTGPRGKRTFRNFLRRPALGGFTVSGLIDAAEDYLHRKAVQTRLEGG